MVEITGMKWFEYLLRMAINTSMGQVYYFQGVILINLGQLNSPIWWCGETTA